MNRDTKITLAKQIDVTDMAGDKVMIDFDTGKYYMLKGTAADIWDNIQEETTVGALIDTLTKIYDVDEKTCFEGVEGFLNQLAAADFVKLA